ncbi:hypothetical protein B0H63DRAFT_433322 [Podospora didyma]|uniref:Uncharacterized protein n=1 Tax=Podospora didyma TaxID=330526 RepID=A0AAE0NPZ7_9PEZI|nr:hypothetical protein B0H63DRAFT_433322 [Podospora didyma]
MALKLPYRPNTSSPVVGTANDPGSRFVAVGIDFGTTYCGVSWAFSGRPDAIYEVSEWPSHYHLNAGEDQVPTVYDIPSGRWGYEVTPKMKPVKWFKLLLLKDKDFQSEEIRNSPPLQSARSQLEASSLSPTKVIGMYLKKLWEHTYSQIASRLDVENLPLRVAITVPAIWPPYAEQAMREAAKLAGITADRDIGITTLDLVQEPEAAGLSIFLDRRGFPEIQAGESFVVCDAGGGTIDVISYTVRSTSPFHIGECVKGDGKLAGAYKVDEAFETYLKEEMKLKLDSFETAEHNVFLTKDWEMGAKRAFAGLPEPPKFFLTPPPKAVKTFDRLKGKGSFGITREMMTRFFVPSLTGIQDLLRIQIKKVQSKTKKSPKRILLVGGLGGSQYIYNELSRQYPNIVLRPLRPWSAVARGSVIRLLQEKLSGQENLEPGQKAIIDQMPEVVSRTVRYSYGVESKKVIDSLDDFDEALDPVTIDPDGSKVALRMDWYLRKGDDVAKKKPVLLGYSQFSKGSAPKSCRYAITYSAADIPPKRPDSTVMELCTIDCEWDKPFEEWQKVGKRGWRVHQDLALAMRFEGQTKWTVRVGSCKKEHEVKVEYMS